jgi:colanic acid biosynthesis glycosyl transferase WcaI
MSMKVLFLNQTYHPDVMATAQHLTDLSLYLKEKGCEVTVVTGRRGYNDRHVLYPAYENFRGIHVHRVDSTGFGKEHFFYRILDAFTFDLLLAWKLLWLPKQDLIVAFTSPPLLGLFAIAFHWLKGGRVGQWLMDLNPDAAIAVGYLNPKSFITRFLVGVFRFTLRHSDHLVVLDRWMKKTIVAQGAKENRIEIIPPWPVHAVVKGAPSSQNRFRAELGLEGKFILLYSGNHSVVHPLDTLLGAALALGNQSDVVFVFTGSGLRTEDVARFKARHGLINILQLPYQPREALADSLGMADLQVVVMGDKVSGLVHTSKIYGILASQRPYLAIAPRESHLVDLLKECPYGFHAEQGDVEGVLSAIEKAKALTASEKEEYATQNLSYLQTHFRAEDCMEAFYSAFALDRVPERAPLLVSEEVAGS